MADETGQGARAPYAADAARAPGRLVAEPPSATRTEFQRDRDRIVHSTAFRRLAHKTQVFVDHEGDHSRTRLTHTIEVAQIARALARALQLDDDLAEAVALGHDLGHTPFGHTGEDALDACMADYGGFDHNSHALRIVTELERRYAEFDGLNLTGATLAGLVKHNGPLLDASGAPTERYRKRGVPEAILAHDRLQPLDLGLYASLEAQAAALADDIAYDAHDIDDGLRAGLFTLGEIRAAAPFVAELMHEVDDRYPGLEEARAIHELSRRVITRFIEDAIGESRRRIAEAKPQSPEAVATAGRALVGLVGRDRGRRPRRQDVPVRKNVSPSVGARGARQGRRDRAAAVSCLYDGSVHHAARLGGEGGAGGARPRRRRLHRGNDRPFRHPRKRPPF